MPPHPVLHFYTVGVPRSGTTYFGHLINSHSRAICSQEVMAPAHVALDWFSEAGLSKAAPYKPGDSIEKLLKTVRSKPEHEVFGDKNPRGFFHLPRLLHVFQSGVVYVILREPAGIFASFNERANRETDPWPDWMRWMHAYLEVVHLIETLVAVPDAPLITIGYDYLTASGTRATAAQRIFDALRLDMEPNVDEFLNTSERVSVKSKTRTRSYSECETELLTMPHMQRICDVFSAWSMNHSARVRTQALVELERAIRADAEAVHSLLHRYLTNDGAAHVEQVKSYFRFAGGKPTPIVRYWLSRLVQSPDLKAALSG